MKAQLEAQMLSALPTGSTVTAALVQTSTVPVPDPDGTFCGTGAVSGILDASAKGMGRATQTYDGTSWDAGSSIAATCTAITTTGRRRLQTNKVDHAVTATDDISQHVTGTTFATTLAAQIGTEAAAASITVTVPTLTVDHASIEYTNVVTYTVTSTSATAVTTSGLTTHLQTAVTSSMVAAGFTATEAAALATTAVSAITVTSTADPSTGITSVSGASTAGVSAALVAAITAAVAFLFQ